MLFLSDDTCTLPQIHLGSLCFYVSAAQPFRLERALQLEILLVNFRAVSETAGIHEKRLAPA